MDAPEAGLDFSAPIIIVGPGRSGTTTLGAALGEHPDCYMIGETQFLLQRMWRTFCEQKDYVNSKRLTSLAQQTRSDWRDFSWYTFVTEIIARDPDGTYGNLFAQLESVEQARTMREMGASFARLLIPPALRKRRWGFQETWLGNDSFPYSSEIYRNAFPDALYLHSVRNPFSFLASNFNTNKEVATAEGVKHGLTQWLRMTHYARSFADTKRYMEFRFEDLVGDGGDTAERVFKFCGLDLVERCRRALSIRHLPSNGQYSFIEPTDDYLASVPGLMNEMISLGYAKPFSPQPVS
jgi:hypothetical protein